MDMLSVKSDCEADGPISPPSDAITEAILRAQQVALRMIVEKEPLKNILSELATSVEAIDPRASVASILLLDAAGRLWTGAGPRLPDDYNAAIDGLKAERDLGTCAHAAVTGEVVITPSIADCERWELLKELPLGLGLKAAWSQPIKARDGAILGTFGTYFRETREPSALERRLVETLAETAALAIETHQGEERRLHRERLHGRALDAAAMGVWRYDLITGMVEVDERARELYSSDQNSFPHDEEGARAFLHPDDIPAMWAAVDAATDPEGDGRYQAEYRTRRKDGSWRWLSVWGLTEFMTVDGQRTAIAIDGASRDISEIKSAAAMQQLLLRELSHRVRNNLAVVQSIAQQTLRTKSNPAIFAETFNGRISALATAHSLLTKSIWRGATLGEIASSALEPFGDSRIRADGPELRIPAAAAVTFTLLFHELATNAHKYGSLSAGGSVAINWDVDFAASEAGEVSFSWREEGGPPPRATDRKGFGSKLIEIAAAQLGGTSNVDLRPEGLVCRLEFPVPGDDLDEPFNL